MNREYNSKVSSKILSGYLKICKIRQEIEHIQVWTTANKLVINQDKTKEIVFRRPRPSYFHTPLVEGNIEQLDSVKFLGVMVQNNLKMDVHVKYVLSQCA